MSAIGGGSTVQVPRCPQDGEGGGGDPLYRSQGVHNRGSTVLEGNFCSPTFLL